MLKPQGLGWIEAGSLMSAALTSLAALETVAVGEGDTVLLRPGRSASSTPSWRGPAVRA